MEFRLQEGEEQRQVGVVLHQRRRREVDGVSCPSVHGRRLGQTRWAGVTRVGPVPNQGPGLGVNPPDHGPDPFLDRHNSDRVGCLFLTQILTTKNLVFFFIFTLY